MVGACSRVMMNLIPSQGDDYAMIPSGDDRYGGSGLTGRFGRGRSGAADTNSEFNKKRDKKLKEARLLSNEITKELRKVSNEINNIMTKARLVAEKGAELSADDQSKLYNFHRQYRLLSSQQSNLKIQQRLVDNTILAQKSIEASETTHTIAEKVAHLVETDSEAKELYMKMERKNFDMNIRNERTGTRLELLLETVGADGEDQSEISENFSDSEFQAFLAAIRPPKSLDPHTDTDPIVLDSVLDGLPVPVSRAEHAPPAEATDNSGYAKQLQMLSA